MQLSLHWRASVTNLFPPATNPLSKSNLVSDNDLSSAWRNFRVPARSAIFKFSLAPADVYRANIRRETVENDPEANVRYKD
jgi:hypothetical protein